MSRFLDITLPHPHRALRPNGRAHWAMKARKTKEARFRAWLMVHNAVWDADALLEPRFYTLTWYYKGALPDADNCLASCKAYLDGAAAAFGVDDRSWECAGITRVHDKTRAGELVLEFTEEIREMLPDEEGGV